MLTLDEIRERLQPLRCQDVADAANVHYNTVRMIRDNPNANPKYKVLIKLSDALEKMNNDV